MQVTSPSDIVGRVAGEVGPAVVGLGRGWGRGSGVVVARDTVLTVAHAVSGEEATVRLGGEREAGRVLGVDPDLDVAVVRVPTGDATPVAWEPDAVEALGIGSDVVALADPGGRGLRVTHGVVSAHPGPFRGPRGRRVRGVEHTAPLPRGSSGGPLVDPAGRLLGVNALRLDGGLILAVAADAALRERVDALARGEAIERPRLGVALAPPRVARRLRRAVGLPEREGLLVRAVQDDSPAARAGIERGDLIVAPASTLDGLHEALERANGTLVLGVVRGEVEREVEVEL